MNIAHLFRSRLRRDLQEINANADPGIHVHVARDDMRRLCLQLCPETGPWARLRLHFTVELPSKWVRILIRYCCIIGRSRTSAGGYTNVERYVKRASGSIRSTGDPFLDPHRWPRRC